MSTALKILFAPETVDLGDEWDTIITADPIRATTEALRGNKVYVPMSSRQSWLPQIDLRHKLEKTPASPIQVFVVTPHIPNVPGMEHYTPTASGMWCCPADLASEFSRGNANALILAKRRAKHIKNSHDPYRDAAVIYVEYRTKLAKIMKTLALLSTIGVNIASIAPVIALFMT